MQLSKFLVRMLFVASGLIVLATGSADALPQGAWSDEGDQHQAHYGTSVATAGDVNGDGYSDFLVGAPLMNGEIEDDGRVFLYHGSPAGLGAASWSDAGESLECDYGRSAASAGDINGDGYDDVIVGASGDEFIVENEGRAFLYLGSPTGLHDYTWSDRSGDAGADYGWKVAPAGDVNGDGFDDFLVGAPGFTGHDQSAGRAYCYLGAADGTPVLDWIYEGSGFAHYVGYDVSTAGDVNGDGYDDVIIGAYGYNRCYVFHGGPGGLSTQPDRTIWGSTYFGWSVSTAGDTNGDGYADIVVGWPYYGANDEGRAYVYFGSAQGVTTNAWTHETGQAGARFGYDVECAGDVNGDGYSDLLVGAQRGGTNEEGQAFLFYGSPQGPMEQPLWVAVGTQDEAYFGGALGTAGDVNGDGYSDFGVGARQFDNPDTNEGKAAVWHGSSDAPGKVEGWHGEENQERAEYGHALALGDFNGDGYSDIVVGTGGWDGAAGEDAGRVWVYSGRDTIPSSVADWRDDGRAAFDRFGDAVANALDVDNDGYDDLLVGVPGYEGDRGAAVLYLGTDAGLRMDPSWMTVGESAGDQYGFSVSRAGDVNGDGYADVIIGAQTYTGTRAREGKAYVFHGSETGLGGSAAWTAVGRQDDARFGYDVCTAGDVNADGYSDVIVGAPLLDSPEVDEGAAFVYLGSEGGVREDPIWSDESDQAGAQFGFAVTTAGDANADGYSDVAVGAPFFDGSSADAGMAAVYEGEDAGVKEDPLVEWFASEGSLGWALDAADLNGDRYSDLVIGAPFVDNGQVDEGQVYAVPGPYTYGGTWFANDGNAPLAWHGMAVATGGDVTGDGFADILSGMPGMENPHVQEGVAVVWHGNGMWETYGIPVPFVHGLDRRPQVRVADDTAPVALLGRSDPSVLFAAHGRTPLGRGRVGLEIEVKRFGIPFDGTGTVVTDLEDTGAPVAGDGSFVELSRLVAGLTDETMYRWRMRVVSDHPYWKRSPWFTASRNGATELDFRVGGGASDVVGGTSDPARALSLRAYPAPLTGSGTLSFRLASAGPVKLAVYDAGGRLVRTLADEVREAGPHNIDWNGADAAGRPLPSGVYFAVLRTEAAMRMARVVLAR